MLIEYINKAMTKAVYEKLENGTYSGKIPQCPGVVAFGETLYQCQEELRSVLEGWLIVKIRHGDRLPVIGGINLNNKMPASKDMVVHVDGLPANEKIS
jgi:predicted RNase H-like HicB family nuclease